MTRPKSRFTFLCALLFALTFTQSFAQESQTGGAPAEQPSESQSLESQRAELNARESVLAEARETLAPQQAEVQRRRKALDQQLAALTAQETALQTQEDALNAQEGVSEAQREALELQRQAVQAQQAALQDQIQEVEALEAELAAQEETLAAQEAEVETLRASVRQAEQERVREQEVAQQARQNLLESLLVTLENNPRYIAAQAAVRAAEAQLSAAYNPASLEVQGSYNRSDVDPVMAPQQEPGQGEIPDSQTQLSTNATFRPFPFGDTRDAVQQQELALENAVLDFRESVTGLERQALEAALQFQLAQQSVELVQNTLEAARSALEATQERFDRGAANERELRDAEANFQQAQNALQNAQADLDLARLSLRNLDLEDLISVLESSAAENIGAFLALPRVNEGSPLSVQRSQISLAQAAIGVGSARRDLYPTANASYSYNLDDSSSLSASIESRTLQPSIGYSYQDPERSFPESAINSGFQVGVSASISFGVFNQIDAAESQREAARAGLEASQEGAELQNASLENALNQAERTVALEQIQFDNAQRAFEENQQRQELGLITPLEVQQSLVDLLEEDLELRQARLSALQALLDTYEFYALPPSEVLP